MLPGGRWDGAGLLSRLGGNVCQPCSWQSWSALRQRFVLAHLCVPDLAVVGLRERRLGNPKTIRIEGVSRNKLGNMANASFIPAKNRSALKSYVIGNPVDESRSFPDISWDENLIIGSCVLCLHRCIQGSRSANGYPAGGVKIHPMFT